MNAAQAQRLREEAERLRDRFHEALWMPEDGFYALALDAKKQSVGVIALNIGHCVWTGIVNDRMAHAVIDRLTAPDMFTGFGIRTLSAGSARYDPVSYHSGCVWSHDTVIAAAGMGGYGREDADASREVATKKERRMAETENGEAMPPPYQHDAPVYAISQWGCSRSLRRLDGEDIVSPERSEGGKRTLLAYRGRAASRRAGSHQPGNRPSRCQEDTRAPAEDRCSGA